MLIYGVNDFERDTYVRAKQRLEVSDRREGAILDECSNQQIVYLEAKK